MAFEELKQHTENIPHHANAFFESNITYYKLWGFKVAMKSTTMIFKFTLIVLCLSTVLLFFSIAGAFAIGKALGNYALGFLIIGGVYIVFTVILFLIKDKIVEGPILEKFSEIFYND